MNLVQSVKTCFKKYFVIDGRASRSEYWWFLLFASFSPLLLIVLIAFLFSGEKSENFYSIIILIFYLPVLAPWITVSIRRLHDLDKSGKIFIPYIVLETIITIDTYFPGLNFKLLMILEFISVVLMVYFFIIFMFKGSNKKNKYGSPIKLQSLAKKKRNKR
jgi:uncharacterized membrane protein YhaH (DUF805 family)